jgi:hypothetical protein
MVVMVVWEAAAGVRVLVLEVPLARKVALVALVLMAEAAAAAATNQTQTTTLVILELVVPTARVHASLPITEPLALLALA